MVDFSHLWTIVTAQDSYILPSSGTDPQEVPSRVQARPDSDQQIPENFLKGGVEVGRYWVLCPSE